jgi:hypothetical protein
MRSSYNMKSVILKAIIIATTNTLTLTLQTSGPLKVRRLMQVISKHSQRCSFIMKNCAEMAILLLEKPQFDMVTWYDTPPWNHNTRQDFIQRGHFQVSIFWGQIFTLWDQKNWNFLKCLITECRAVHRTAPEVQEELTIPNPKCKSQAES